MKEKVFCIGLSKTGTSNLSKALEYMGFHVGRRQVIFKQHLHGLDLINSIEAKEFEEIFKILPYYDAFVDNPWPLLYREIAMHNPNAKFILTTREEESWLNSVLNYFGNSHSRFRKLIYGESNPKGHEPRYLERFRSHNEEVKRFFSSAPNRLLVLPLEEKNKWQVLSEFLKTTAPSIEYPHHSLTNGKKQGDSFLKRIVNVFQVSYIEVAYTLAYARILTLFFPFKVIAKKMARSINEESTGNNESKLLGKAIKLSQITKSMSKKMPFRTLCFEQALCMQLLLKRRGVASKIYFGVNSKTDKLAAHAWSVLNGVTLTGEKSKEEFTVVNCFTNQASQNKKGRTL